MEQEKFSQLQLIRSLINIAHSKSKDKSEKAKLENIYNTFAQSGLNTVNADPHLFARTMAWNHKNGKIFDSKVIFPIIALKGDSQFAENAICHACSLGPRELNRSSLLMNKFAENDLRIRSGQKKKFQQGIQKYIKIREANRKWWTSCVVQHKKAMKSLYKISHTKPAPFADQILFKNIYPKNSVFEVIKNLKNMSTKEAAGHILNHKIPLTVAIGSVSSIKNNDILIAVMKNLTANELQNNSVLLEKLGVMSDSILKAAFDEACERAKKDKKANVYKASIAKNKIKNKKMANKLVSIQSEQEKTLKGIEGDCLILSDRSGSMSRAIDESKKVAALVASQTKGKVHFIFFDEIPEYYDVTGMDYNTICLKTKHVKERGCTSIGCGLDYMMKRNLNIDIIIIISDGGENASPHINDMYKKYITKFNYEPAVYHLWLPGAFNSIKHDFIQFIDISKNFDEYAFINLLSTIKTDKYKLLDEILATPLLTYNQVFKGV